MIGRLRCPCSPVGGFVTSRRSFFQQPGYATLSAAVSFDLTLPAALFGVGDQFSLAEHPALQSGHVFGERVMVVAYDALAESIALIESTNLKPVTRLSRRRRFAAMAVDVAGDVALTMFARRGAGCVWEEIHVLARRHGRWYMLGGGGGTGEGDLLTNRPQVLPANQWASPNIMAGIDPQDMIASGSAGGVLDNGGRTSWWPGRGRWISYGVARTSARVASVRVDGRVLDVPWHGRVPMVWVGRKSLLLAAYDERQQCLGKARFPGPR